MATTTTYPVHPAAAVFPMMADAELDDLAKDIKERGLLDKIVLWRPESDAGLYLLDGRNRLAALERIGQPIEPHTTVLLREEVPDAASAAAYVISRNIRRRHLTKEQQAELIIRAIKVTKTDDATLARPVPRDERGRVRGSTKDPVLAAAVEEGTKHDISERTMKRVLATVKAETGPPRKVRLVRGPSKTISIRAPFVGPMDEPAVERAAQDVRAELRHVLAEGRRRMKTLKRAPLRRLHSEFVTWILGELDRIVG